jgi:hypothetical protein
MAKYPEITRMCPYLDRLDTVMEGDFCRMCRRNVHDLSAMGEKERAVFLASCSGEVCVSYTVWMKPALAAAALAASGGMVMAIGGTFTPAEPKPEVAYMVTGEIVQPEPVQLAGLIALPPENNVQPRVKARGGKPHAKRAPPRTRKNS